MQSTLIVNSLEHKYGGIQSLRGVGMEVHDNEVVALVGANGAGKTTLLRCISGILQALRRFYHLQWRTD